MDKQLARWIYYEDGDLFYCMECVEERMKEINENHEFSKEIDFDNGDTCGYYEDYAYVDYAVECCKCGTPLYSTVDC